MAEHPTPTTSDADGMPRVVTPRPEEASAVLDLADRAGAADGHPPLSDQTRVLLARGGQLWWGATRGPDGAIDGAAVFAKIVGRGRGGYCFEQNRLFGDALAALGFRARALLARVWLGVEDVPPLTHTLSLVTIDGRDWIADPGFGGSYAPPMPLVDGAEATAPDGARWRLQQDGDGWLVLRNGPAATTDGRGFGPGWQRQYGFALDEVGDADLARGNEWAGSSPDSRFTRLRVVSLPLPTGFASLTDRDYRRRAGTEEVVGEITDPRVYRLRLSLMFGIDLTREEIAALGLF